MSKQQRFSLLDSAATVCAEVEVEPGEQGWLVGTIIRQTFSEDMKQAFRWHEEVVNDQMFSFLDEAEAAIERYGWQVVPEGGGQGQPIHDLQIMGTDIAFRLAVHRSQRERPAPADGRS